MKKQGEKKTIWHDKNEEPCEDRQVLICLSGNYYVDFYHKEDKRFYMFCKPKHYLHEIEKWAYLDDLLEKQGEKKPNPILDIEIPLGAKDNELQEYTFEIKEGHWYKCVCDYMLNNSDLLFKYGKLYYCRRNWRLDGEIDERNVKDIGVNGYKSFFRPATNQEIKDWLEKQGKITIWDKKDEKILNAAISHIKNKTYNYCGGYTSEYVIQWLESLKDRYIWTPSEKQGEKKPADKIESKFKDGQWIVFNGLTLYIKEVVKGYYRTISIDGTPNSYDWDIDNAARLWTLNEAKDGDVLVYEDYGSVKIFIYQYGKVHYHCCLTNNHFISYNSYFGVRECRIHPADKKQRDLLFVKMKEVGYKWDKDKNLNNLNMTQLEIYKRQLEIATQMLENAKNHNLSSEDINKFQELYDLCKRSIEVYENNQEY